MEQESKHKKGRSLFNVFDLALIAVALILGAVLFLKGRGEDLPVIDAPADEAPILCTLEAKEVDERLAESVKAGDPVFDRAKKYSIGTVQSVEAVPSKRFVVDYENRRRVQTEVEGKVDLIIVVAATAEIDSRGVTVDGGFDLRVGSGVNLKLPGLALYPTVIGIERVEQS